MPAKVNSRHSQADRGDDLYETPAVAVHALARVEALPRLIWEPACGPGAIVRELQALGHDVIATDKNDYGLPGARGGIDFLTYRFPKTMPDVIVTNPPFFIAQAFAERAISLSSKVCLLLRLGFLSSRGRFDFFQGSKLARVHVFSNRLPMMHRDGWDGKKSTSNVDHAWFVFDASHVGPAAINHILWEPVR